MKTNPIYDSWTFLIGVQPDQLNLGAWRFLMVALFALLLIASVAIAAYSWQRDPEQQTAANLLGWIFRVAIGIMWFQGSLWKLPLPDAGALHYWTEQMVDNAAFPFVSELVKTVALPNFTILDPLVFLLELGLAVSFILGFGVRLTATVGAFYALGLWLGLYRHPGEWPWEYIFLAVLQAQFAVHATGRALGLDGWGRQRVYYDPI